MSTEDPTQAGDGASASDETRTSDGMTVTPDGAASALPDRIGRYRIIRTIGEGGMGTVFEAEQQQPRRTVALKVIRPGLATPRMLRRFELEAHVLGRLQHPGIAQVYEAGTAATPSGTQPYFAMEYIRGVNLTEHVRRNVPSPSDRLELVTRICDAVHHAHQKGVIHRDLKPSNILVDLTGQPKILDFGVARATDSDMQVTTLQTDVGQIIGTLQYMSPEQVAGSPDDLDTRSDVYALGVIAYELLSGSAPYNLKDRMILEAARVISEEEPTRLSAVSRSFRGDVETIVAKALEKDKNRRYQSAAELAADIRRYLQDEPIVARPPSAIYQLQKFAKRNKALAGGLSVAMAALLVGLATSTYLYVQAENARQGEQHQRALAEEGKDEAETARAEAQARAEELKIVTEFQQSMLGEIDAETMGRGIVAAQRERIRERLENDGVDPEALQATLASFDALVGKINATNLALNVIDEHVLAQAAATIEKDFADQPQVRAALQQTLGTTYRGIGLYAAAMPLQKAAVETRTQELGDDHPETLASQNEMGSLLERMGQLSEAEPYFRKALEGRRRLLGDDHQDTLVSINNLGLLLYWLGKPEETLPLYREALEGSRRVLGEDAPNTLIAMNNMSILLQDMGKFDEAEAYRREALAGQRRVLGEDDPNTLISVFNMGYLHQAKGDFEQALQYYRETLEGQRRVLGDDHPRTLESMHSVGMMLDNLGKAAEAEGYYRGVMEGRRRVLGDDHYQTLTSINNMGYLLNKLGRYHEAVQLLQEAEPAARRAWVEPRSRLLGVYLAKLGAARAGLRQFADAQESLLESYAVLSAGFGENHTRTKDSVKQLIALYESWDAAEPGNGHDTQAAEWRTKLPDLPADEGSAKPVGD